MQIRQVSKDRHIPYKLLASWMLAFLKKNLFTLNIHAFIGNSKEIPYILHPVFPSGNILHNCGTIAQQEIDSGKIHRLHSDFSNFHA